MGRARLSLHEGLRPRGGVAGQGRHEQDEGLRDAAHRLGQKRNRPPDALRRDPQHLRHLLQPRPHGRHRRRTPPRRTAPPLRPSVPRAYQDAIEKGWLDGVSLIQRIGANARYFTDSANKVPLDVGAGNAAAGICIDFYGLFEADVANGPRGAFGPMGFRTPAGESGVSADPALLLRGSTPPRARLPIPRIPPLPRRPAPLVLPPPPPHSPPSPRRRPSVSSALKTLSSAFPSALYSTLSLPPFVLLVPFVAAPLPRTGAAQFAEIPCASIHSASALDDSPVNG